jgi:hypothetical protein
MVTESSGWTIGRVYSADLLTQVGARDYQRDGSLVVYTAEHKLQFSPVPESRVGEWRLESVEPTPFEPARPR